MKGQLLDAELHTGAGLADRNRFGIRGQILIREVLAVEIKIMEKGKLCVLIRSFRIRPGDGNIL